MDTFFAQFYVEGYLQALRDTHADLPDAQALLRHVLLATGHAGDPGYLSTYDGETIRAFVEKAAEAYASGKAPEK